MQEIEPNENSDKILQKYSQMGCTTPQKQQNSLPVPLSTTSGILKITITNAVIFHQAGVFKMDPYVMLKLSNQQFVSKIAIKGSKKPNFFETFTFYINSSFKEYGRNLQMTMMDKKKIGADNLIGYGIVDINPIINHKKPKDEFRCMLNYEYKQAGFINVIAQFAQESTQTLHFRFDQATIRRNTSTFGNMNCWIQVIIGEEVMQTSKKMDTKQKPPSWISQALSFKVLKSIKKCKIRVMDDEKQVGHLDMDVDKLLSSEVQQQFTEDFQYENGVYAGTMKFETIKGKSPSFSQPRQTVKQRKSALQKQYSTKLKDDSYIAQYKAFTSLPPNPYANNN